MVSAPSAPDPYQTAAAQSQMNKDTANYQSSLNNVSQITPYGSLTYEQNGTWDNGAPRYTATQTLSPEEMGIYNTGMQTRQNLANIGREQSSRIGDLLNSPFNLDSASETQYEKMARSRLDPLWQQKRDQFESGLVNRGVRPGTEAYGTLMGQFGQQENDAYNSMYTAGKQLFDTEAQAQRNQPINEISALMSGSQVSSPNYVNTPQTGVANTDLIGAVNNSYNQQMSAYNAMMGGLFGLGGSLGSAAIKYGMFSDRRLKRSVERIGTTLAGLPVYVFSYLWDNARHIGYMADEVEAMFPLAVGESGGFKTVNYGAF